MTGPGASSKAWAEARRQRLARLMAARLVLAIGVFALALGLVGAGQVGAESSELGLYGTLAGAFLTTAIYAAALRFVRNLDRFAALQIATDVAIVTAVLVFSGGGRSIFSFLYLPITLYAAIWFDRWGAYAAAVGCSLAYGAAFLMGGPPGARDPSEVAFALWGVHTGALLLVALLSSTLAHELRVKGEQLDEHRSSLRELQGLHERTVECLTSGLLTTDGEGRITSFNPEAEHITGRSAARVRGRSLAEVVPGAEALTARGAPGAGRMRSRIRVQGSDGAEQHLGVAVSRLRGPEGEDAGSVVIFQDVTPVVEMEREIQRSARLAGVGQLAADMAHEVRNPLAAISGCVEVLRAGPASSEERRRLMEIVLREIRRLDGLIGNFLQYARPAPPKLEALEVAPVLEEVAEMARRPDRRVLVSVEADPGLSVEADGGQLRQVLWNLVRNGEQSIESEGTIRLRASLHLPSQGAESLDRNADGEGRTSVEITVADTGAGIPPEILERIFDPFFTTKVDGSGLGLATVHRIVEGLGGSLSVESRPGDGTSVRLLLPAAVDPR